MPLTDVQIKGAKPKEKPYKLSDGGWLYLLVNPIGSKLWRMAYRFDGREKLLALGAYPEVPLKDARAKRDEARALLATGVDPGERKKSEKSLAILERENTFDAITAKKSAARARPKRPSPKTSGRLGSPARPSAQSQSLRSLPPTFWRSCAPSRSEGATKPPFASAPLSDRSFATPSRPADAALIRPSPCAGR
jgi:hypothetical protein